MGFKKILFFFYVIAECFFYSEVLSISVIESALLAAVNANDPTAVRDAIESGANVNLTNGTGFTPLHVAAAQGHVVAMSVLLRQKIDIEAVTNAGARPLHLAASSGNSQAVALLAVAGADLHAKDQEGRTALQRAARFNLAVALLRALLYPQVQNLSGVSNETVQALWNAVFSNDPEGVRDALEFGADIDGRYVEYYNGSALELAAGRGNVEAMCVLLKAGANKEIPDSSNDRPLHEAARLVGRDVPVGLLVVAGADLYATGGGGATPLLRNKDNHSAVSLLRALGAWR